MHGVAFVLFGIVAALLIAGAEREPLFLFALVILFTAFEVFFFGAVIIGAKWVLDELAGWTDLRRQPPGRRRDARLLLQGPPRACPPADRGLG